MRGQQPHVSRPGAGPVIALAVGIGLALALYGVLQLGGRLATGEWTPGHPVAVLWALGKGERPWTGWDTAAAAAVILVLVLALVGAGLVRRRLHRRHGEPLPVDRKAQHMGSADTMTRKAVEEKSARGRLTTIDQPGLMIARSVKGRTDLYLGWRETAVVEMGPGSGKTTGIAVPMVLDAPGVVVCTSNKRDLADGIRGACEARGTFWCFDPQDIAHYGAPDWWWNPLRGITDPVEALRLAQIIADASSPADASKDAYFDAAGPQLLADLILAAAVDGRQIDQVYRWVSDSDTKRSRPEPVRILEDHGYALSAASLRRPYGAADDERSGIFGTAAKSLSFLTSPTILRWVTEPDEPLTLDELGDGLPPRRREFVPAEFVRSDRDTLVSLSREGVGSAGPLTAALTVAVTSAAERFATENPHGRLPVPLVAVLDEVANVCRWRELPAMFSHYGSAGITLFAILQNWSQAVNAWKAAGAQQMWDAANIRIVGAGIADRRHLEDLAALIGERHVERRSVSASARTRHGGGQSVTSSWDREQIMSVDELAGLPAGRVVVVPAGGYPILARTVPWWDRPAMAEAVAASVNRYEPGGTAEDERLGELLTVSDPIENGRTQKVIEP